MSSPESARREATATVASLAALLSPARAEASRKNGAKSRGPRTLEGKARSAQNALRHGLRAEKHVVVAGESAEAFAAFEAALRDDLAPEGALQTLLAGRIARAAWRLERADRIEAELFAREMKGLFDDGDLGLALIRDGNGARAFDVLLRYRGAAQAEFSRALRMLKALQAEQAQEPAPVMPAAPRPRAHAADAMPERPIEPEPRRIPGESAPAPAAHAPALAPVPAARPPHPCTAAHAQPLRPVPPAPDAAAGTRYRAPEAPIEPETRGIACQTVAPAPRAQ